MRIKLCHIFEGFLLHRKIAAQCVDSNSWVTITSVSQEGITDHICEFICHLVIYLGTKLFTRDYLVNLKVLFKLFRHLNLSTGRQLSRHYSRDFSLPQFGGKL